MWTLEECSKKTQLVVRDFHLPNLTTDDVQRLLGLGDSVKIGDHWYPLEAGMYDVPDHLVHTFADYGGVRGIPLIGMEYQIGYNHDQ